MPSATYELVEGDLHRHGAALARGTVTNVAFADLCKLAEALGFELRRVSGSHHVFAHPEVPQLINLQSLHGQAKP